MEDDILFEGYDYPGSDVYEKIKEKFGEDVLTNPNYIVSGEGVEDNNGISESLYTKVTVRYSKINSIGAGLNNDDIIMPTLKNPNPNRFYGNDDHNEDVIPNKETKTPIKEVIPNEKNEDPIIGVLPDNEEKIAVNKNKVKDKLDKIIVRVVKSRKINKALFIPALALALAATLTSGLKKSANYKDIEEKQVKYETEYSDDLDYDISGDATISEINEQENENLLKVLDGLYLGNKYEVKDGLDYYETSAWETDGAKHKIMGEQIEGNQIKTFNNEGKYAGNYVLSGVSVVIKSTGEKINYIEAFHEKNIKSYQEAGQTNIGTFVRETIDKYNLKPGEFNVRLHYGEYEDISVLGWIDVSSILSNELVSKEDIEKQIENGLKASGTINNFEGNSITVKLDDNDVTIPVKDSNGNLLPNGSEVIGSDGQSYKINNLEIETNEKTNAIEETVHSTVLTGTSLKFDISNVNLIPLLTAGLSFAGILLGLNKYNKFNKKNAKYDEFKNEEIYNNFIKSTNNNDSVFKKVQAKASVVSKLTELVFPSKDDITRLDKDSVDDLQKYLWSYVPDNNIKDVYVDHNHVMFVYKDGKTEYANFDLTGLKIGEGDEVVASGLVPEYYSNGYSLGELDGDTLINKRGR